VRVVVVGTGTEVGKTYVSCALMRGLGESGLTTVGLKPVESGLGEAGVAADARALAGAAGHATVEPRYGFERAVSPHLEARRVGVAVVVADVVSWVGERSGGDVTVVETAGGLLSPLSVSATNLDVVVALDPTVVLLVAANRLGVLHDVRACVLALEGAGSRVDVVALNDVGARDASTGSNAEELEQLGIASLVVSVPRAGLGGTLEASRELAAAVTREPG